MAKKVTVIGAGFVGAGAARRIVERDLADVVLVDVVEGLAHAKALDIMESSPIEGFSAKITGTNEYSQTADSNVVVITAGIARRPGMSRDDLQATNAKIVRQVVENVVEFSPNAVLVIVTNPLDIMSYLALKVSGFNKERVIGMAGLLDSARYRYFIAEELLVCPSDVTAMVLGGHGDSMVPLPRYSSVNGIPLTEILPEAKIAVINERTKTAGAEIVGLLKKGSAYYAPSSAAVQMVKAILHDENRLLPCSVYLEGEYDINGVFCGVPVKLGRKGVKEILNIELTDKEIAALRLSTEKMNDNIKKLKS